MVQAYQFREALMNTIFAASRLDPLPGSEVLMRSVTKILCGSGIPAAIAHSFRVFSLQGTGQRFAISRHFAGARQSRHEGRSHKGKMSMIQ
jgi:hypothetical protein